MWRTVKLGDVCTLRNGRAYKKPELLSEGKYPVLRVGNFFTSDNWYHSDLELDDTKYCDNGDLLYAWSASFGPRIWEGKKVIYHYHIWRVDVDETVVDKKFLFYWFEHDKELVKAASGTGTTMMHVSKGSMEKRVLSLPPLAEQQRIVAKLDAAFAEIDRAIEVEGNRLLEFERLKSAYLDEKLTKLVHEKSSVCLSDVCERVSVGHVGTTSKYYCDEGIPFIRTQNVSKTGFDDTEVRYITPEFHASLKKSQLKAGDVLLSRVVIDEMRTAIVPKEYGEANCANVILIRPKEQLLPQYLSLLIKSKKSQEYFMGVKKGAAQQVVNTGVLKKWSIPLPSIHEQAAFVEEITDSFEYIECLFVTMTEKRHLLTNLKSAILAQELQPSEAA